MTGSSTLENTMPVMKSTWSRLMKRSTASRAIVRLLLVVDHADLGGKAAELAAVQLHRQQEGVAHVDAERPAGPRQCAEKPDLDLVGRLGPAKLPPPTAAAPISVSS